jgi:glycosyltransferase involved in cell wall biosynthesis
MNNIPKVTVILTSFNHSKYLREAIDSVLFQTYNNYELIIWDDASTDDSWQIIESYTDSRIRAFKNSVTMGAGNINRALKQSKGEYIAIHHSDDIWEPEKLQKQVDFLNKNQDMGAVFTNAHIIGEESEPFVDESHGYYKIFDQPNRARHEWLRYFFEKGNALCHPSVLIRKQCYMDCGFYRYGFAQLTDFDMWVRLALRYDIHVLPEKLVRFRVRAAEVNASGNRTDTRSRGAYEYSLILNHYLKIDRLDDLIKVFPEARKFCDGQHQNLKYVLAMTAIEIRPHHFTIGFALNLLSEILNHPTESSLTPFNSQDFIKLTGELDPVRAEEINTLKKQLEDTNKDYLNSRSWKITKPLRFLVKCLRSYFN